MKCCFRQLVIAAAFALAAAASEAENTADSAKSFLVQKGADTIAKRVCL